MNQITYYLSNVDRKLEYSTETFIKNLGNKKVVYKKSLAKDGSDHINKMLTTSIELNNIIEDIDDFRLVNAKKIKDGMVSFNYIDGKNAERMMVELLARGDHLELISHIDKVISLINQLPSTKLNPTKNKKFVNVFGNTYNTNQDCLSLGILDLNFDNFIIDKAGLWNLIDYEWKFEFALPKKLLIQRMLFWFFIMRYKNISLMKANLYKNIVEIGQDIYVPGEIYNYYEDMFRDMSELVEAEFYLQKFVNKYPRKIDISLLKKANVLEINEAQDRISEKNIIYQYELISRDHAILINDFALLKNELSAIKNSRFYKVAHKISKLVR